jgi:hypothetical protein
MNDPPVIDSPEGVYFSLSDRLPCQRREITAWHVTARCRQAPQHGIDTRHSTLSCMNTRSTQRVSCMWVARHSMTLARATSQPVKGDLHVGGTSQHDIGTRHVTTGEG